MPSADLNVEFLQSKEWLRFQERSGKDVVRFSQDDFSANGIFYSLPLVGKYLYVPKGPIWNSQQGREKLQELIEKAKGKKVGWVRIEPETEELLEEIKKSVPYELVHAPHDVQPKEIFVMDITKDEATLLAEMKSKTRYNIRLAEKHGVKVFATREEKYKQAFLDLIQQTAERKEIAPHPRKHYENFFEVFSPEMCQLFVAEYDDQVVVANIVIFFEGRAIYLHGGSSNTHREVMAPYLLQWKQIQYAKERDCTEYDFGGVRLQPITKNSWSGITKFKLGFSPETQPRVFPGTFDIVLDRKRYALYRFLSLLSSFRRK